jgi:hypothetical protein
MCNLYSLTKSQDAVRALTRALRDVTGNMPSLPGIFPDYRASIVRNLADGVRGRWRRLERGRKEIHSAAIAPCPRRHQPL